MTRIRVFLLITLLFLLVFIGLFFTVLPSIVDKQINSVTGLGLLPIDSKVTQLHEQLIIADLHADSLLWGRDLNEWGERGAVDFPRMRAGNHALQVFSAVTKVPRGININRNKDDSDNILLLALAQRWPWSTYNNLSERALYQASRLQDMAVNSKGDFQIITHRAGLKEFLQRRTTQPELVGGILAIEGAHALRGNMEYLKKFSAAGYRMMSPTHIVDNAVGGSAHGWIKGGLSDFGRQWVKAMNQACMIIDLAHSSKTVFEEVLDLTTHPVVVSHTGVKGTCDNNRNLSDTQLRQVAANEGLIGIGFWSLATCGDTPTDIAQAIKYAIGIAGIKHVALGSDFDGAVAVPFDSSGLIQLTQALKNEGLTSSQIKAVMGDNMLKFLLDNLGEESCYLAQVSAL